MWELGPFFCGQLTSPPADPIRMLNDPDGEWRKVSIRCRRLLVDYWRKKRDGVKLAWQLKAKFAAIWPEVREFLGIRFFVSLIRGQLCA